LARQNLLVTGTTIAVGEVSQPLMHSNPQHQMPVGTMHPPLPHNIIQPEVVMRLFGYFLSFFLSSLSLTLFFVSEDWRSLLLTMLDNTGEFNLNEPLVCCILSTYKNQL
jgi:hypothetical protein